MRGHRDISSRLGGPITEDDGVSTPIMTTRMKDLASDFMEELESTFSKREKMIPKTRTLYSDFYEQEIVSEPAPSTRFRDEDSGGGYGGRHRRDRGGNSRRRDDDYASFSGAATGNGRSAAHREDDMSRRLGSSPSLSSGNRNDVRGGGEGGGRRRHGGGSQDRHERADALKALDARLGLPSVDEFGRETRE